MVDLVQKMDRKTAEAIAFQNASLSVSLAIIMEAGGTTEVFDFQKHPELKNQVSRAIKKGIA